MTSCYHCGDTCNTIILHQDKSFCCHGCKTVYDILHDNDLSYYYDLEKTPGTTPTSKPNAYDYLENEEIVSKLLEFNEQGTHIITLLIPSIHCSSCIWVLENLNKLVPAIQTSTVNFPKKTVRITYNSEQTSLKEVVVLLARLGYEPNLSLNDTANSQKKTDRSLIYKVGVAGFAFGNIMFLSFPEYFEVNEFWLEKFKPLFRWLMFAFSLPVVFYSARGYFKSAASGIRSGFLNIDVPIALGISVLFIRSTVEIVMDWGTGFLDSMTGLVFFLLLGKFFQQKTYAYLSFERDYKSYFPIAVTRLKGISEEEQVPLQKLKKGDRILIRNSELLPVDGILHKGKALIDYSFVTGEAVPVIKQSGEKLFAGGRQQSGPIEVEVQKSIAQSYLTQLWSNDIFSKGKQHLFESITDAISKRFTISLLVIALVATAIWLVVDASKALNVFTAVLIVACPCAIALAAPFTLGNMLRIFGKKKLYCKDSSVIERLSSIDTIVFDKTGTLTTNSKSNISYEGISLSPEEKNLLTSTLRASNHPLSRSLYQLLKSNKIVTLDDFQEAVGEGVTGRYHDTSIHIGSYSYVQKETSNPLTTQQRTAVHISTEKEYKGCYVFYNEYRNHIEKVFNILKKPYNLIILSGDNDGEKEYLQKLLPKKTQFLFNQKPEGKLSFIKNLQGDGHNVMMIGDGLNDAGALAQSDVGIAISENVNVFSPACDAILDAAQFDVLHQFLALSKHSIRIIKYAFIFSIFYNLIGLGYAVSGQLTPVVAAILMPLSSISIVVFTTIATRLLEKKFKKPKTTDKSHLF